MIVVGIDPSLNNVGIAIFKNGKLLRTATIKHKYNVKDPQLKLQNIKAGLRFQLHDLADFKVGIEKAIIRGAFANSGAVVAQSVGAIRMVLTEFDCDIMEIDNKTAKEILGLRFKKGTKQTDKKKAYFEAVKRLYPNHNIKTDHEADAILIALSIIKKIK